VHHLLLISTFIVHHSIVPAESLETLVGYPSIMRRRKSRFSLNQVPVAQHRSDSRYFKMQMDKIVGKP
jgi:hypothetical protein